MIVGRKFRTREGKRRERVRVSVRLSIFLSIFIVACGALIYAMHRPWVRIASYSAQSDGVLEPDVLAAELRENLSGAYLGIVPKDVTFFIRPESLSASLAAAFPRAREVTVRRAGVQALHAEVRERSPKALWCGDVVPPVAYENADAHATAHEIVWGTCYLVDEGGYVYAQAPIYTGNVFPRFYGSLEHAEPVGQYCTAPDEYVRWFDLYVGLATDGHAAQALLFVDERDIEVYLATGLRVLIPRMEDTDTLRRRLSAVLASDLLDTGRTIEYLDLRFGAKAYVKYADELPPPDGTEVPTETEQRT